MMWLHTFTKQSAFWRLTSDELTLRFNSSTSLLNLDIEVATHKTRDDIELKSV